jgi:hypothetical protein
MRRAVLHDVVGDGSLDGHGEPLEEATGTYRVRNENVVEVLPLCNLLGSSDSDPLPRRYEWPD